MYWVNKRKKGIVCLPFDLLERKIGWNLLIYQKI